MPEPELQYPCPVCLGVLMAKLRLGAVAAPLVIDHCRRCGGIWVQAGELEQLRQLRPDALAAFVARGAPAALPLCHACHVPLSRDATPCAACGAENTLECPQCAEPLTAAAHDGVRLDVCRHCRGVWFDHHELDAIWRIELDAAVRRRSARAESPSSAQSSLSVVDVLVWSDPGAAAVTGLAHAGGTAADALARAAGPGADAAAAAAAGAANAATAAAEVAGEAAAGVFETLVEILGGIFS